MIMDAERSKARMNRPSGNDDTLYQKEDKFFHYSAHVDKSLKDKIKLGEYVDLAKLIVKKNLVRNRTCNQERSERHHARG